MTEDFSDLEAELRHLRPRMATPALLRSLEKNLAAPTVQFPSATAQVAAFPAWLNWSAAAAVLLGFALLKTPAPAPNQPEIETQSRVLLAVEDEGIVETEDGNLARQVRRYYLDTHALEFPDQQLTYARHTPHEEVSLVALHLY